VGWIPYWEFVTNQFKHENSNDVCIMYGMRKKSTVFLWNDYHIMWF